MQLGLQIFAHYVAMVLEAMAIVVIAMGALEALYRTLWPMLLRSVTQGMRRNAWLSMARWLVLGLEFMLAADIVRTVIDPEWDDLGKLAVTALVRTFLNFFLERDLEAAARTQEVS